MKGVLLLFISILLSVMLYGQGLAVSADKMNVAYIGIDNPLTIAAEGYSCSQLEVSCENCYLKKMADCTYIFAPNKEGYIDILVSAKTASGLKRIGTKKFSVKSIPWPVATIAGKSNGMIATSAFKVQTSIEVHCEGVEFELSLRTTGFKIEFFRNNELLSGHMVSGPYFSPEVRSQMISLKPGDKIKVTRINVISSSTRERRVNDIYLTLN